MRTGREVRGRHVADRCTMRSVQPLGEISSTPSEAKQRFHHPRSRCRRGRCTHQGLSRSVAIDGHGLPGSKRTSLCAVRRSHPSAALHAVVLRHAVPAGVAGAPAAAGWGILGRSETAPPVWTIGRLKVQVEHQRCVVGNVQPPLSDDGAVH